jgi:hypothetical protein
MKLTLKRFGVFTLVWLVGCAVFDLWLGLSGTWLMLAGSITADIGWVLSRLLFDTESA